ncbi:MAG: hypothetical protein WAV13_05285 [Thermodesulfovibrionales bacterium]
MLIRNKKPFNMGLVLAVSFFAVLLMIFSPIFGGENGLKFADSSFNRLSKGSSYFIPKVSKNVDKYVGKPFSVAIKLDKPQDVEQTAKLFTTAGVKVDVIDTELKLEGDLGGMLKSVLQDSDAMFKNDGKTVSERYGYDEKQVMKNWWAALGKIDKKLKKDKNIQEAKAVAEVTKKAVEPGYNFYKIEGEKVVDHAGMMSGLLVFYVAYTMWWGYAIFYLFDGIGLTMKKAKVKKEA